MESYYHSQSRSKRCVICAVDCLRFDGIVDALTRMFQIGPRSLIASTLIVVLEQPGNFASATMSIKNVMLHHEDYVEENGYCTQTELGEIGEQSDPIIVVVGQHEHLDHAQCTTSEVQDYVLDTPTYSGLALIIVPSLRNVFDDGDAQLDIAEHIQVRQQGYPIGQRNCEGQSYVRNPNQCQDDGGHQRNSLITTIVENDLKDHNQSGENGVKCKDNVVRFHRNIAVRILVFILVLSILEKVQAHIEHAVRHETCDVQCYIIKVESHNTFPLEIDPNLGVKRHGPCHKINPSNDGADQNNCIGLSYDNADIGFGRTVG